MRHPCKLEKLGQSSRQRRRGAAVVEFAVVVPVFLLFVFGMIEYGRMVMVQQILTNASREGARVAVLEGSTRSDVVDWVLGYCAANRITITEDDVSIPQDPETANDGDPVTVTVELTVVPCPSVTRITSLPACNPEAYSPVTVSMVGAPEPTAASAYV